MEENIFNLDITKNWGPRVTNELLNKNGWKCQESFFLDKEDESNTNSADKPSPVFVQECNFMEISGREHKFYRVYRPLNECDVQVSYHGDYIPHDFIFGKDMLSKSHRYTFNEKLEHIVITTDCRIEVCLSSYNYVTLGCIDINSISSSQFNELLLYAKQVIILIDSTEQDIINAYKFALRHPNIYITSLISGDFRNNNKNNPNLRDFFMRNPSSEEVNQMITRARRAQFWEEKKDKEGKIYSYSFSQTLFSFFLEINGYVELKDSTTKYPVYIHIDGIVVERIYAKDINKFINEWGQNNGICISILDSLFRQKIIPSDNISHLNVVDNLNFNSSTSKSQLFYFNNAWIEVTSDNIKEHDYADYVKGCYIWKDTIIPHHFKQGNKQINLICDDEGKYYVEIEQNASSKLLRIVRNMSRLHWRKQDEFQQPLTPEEKEQEEQNLFSFICCIGYLLHRYKSPSASYAVLFLDNAVSDSSNDCNGRNGKSFLISAIGRLNNSYRIDMNDYLNRSNKQFALAGVSEKNGMIFLDECPKDYAVGNLYGKITGPMDIEKKGQDIVQIESSKSPKFAIASNFTLNKKDPSTEARFCKILVSDYYHVQTEINNYKETRYVYDEFNQDIMTSEYSEEDWQNDFFFMIECLQIYLKLPIKERRRPSPTTQIKRRELLSSIDEDFMEWADDYFSKDSENLNRKIQKSKPYNKYKETINNEMKQKTFTINLKKYCELKGYEYNPTDVVNTKDGRIIESSQEKNKAVEYIFIRAHNTIEK